MALSHAVRTGVIARNPAEGARDDLPRAESPSKADMWSPEQLLRFLEATSGDRLYPMWVLAVTTGMRRGEIDTVGSASTARPWRCSASTSFARARTGWYVPPGLGAGRDMCSPTRQDARSSRSTSPSTSYEQSVTPGYPRFRLHDTRHWHATAMLRAGVDVKVVAGRLGHSSTRITQDVYQHRVEQLDRAAAEKVAGLIFEAGGPAGS